MNGDTGSESVSGWLQSHHSSLTCSSALCSTVIETLSHTTTTQVCGEEWADASLPCVFFLFLLLWLLLLLPGALISGGVDLCSPYLESHIWVPAVSRMNHCSGEDYLLWIPPDLTISFRKNRLMGLKRPGGIDRKLGNSHAYVACAWHSKHYIHYIKCFFFRPSILQRE